MIDFADLKAELRKGLDPIPFSKQFQKCTKDGFTSETKFYSFDEYPQYLPAFPNKEMVELINSGEWTGNDFIICGKFGSLCNGGNEQCRQMRGLPPKETQSKK